MKRRALVGVVAAAGMVGMAAAGGLLLSRSRTYQVFGEIVPRVETGERVVALTFDDGPTPKALDELLPVLRARNAKATFFAIGAVLEKFPQLGARIVQDGHELGSHSCSHGSIVLLHPMYRNNKPSLDAMARIVDGLHQRGYRLVTVSELAELRKPDSLDPQRSTRRTKNYSAWLFRVEKALARDFTDISRQGID